MNNSNYGFYFEKAGLGGAQGAISVAAQYFEGSHAESSLVRELGQNSLDARSSDAPVIMEFELTTIRTSDIPDITNLRKHLTSVVDTTSKSQGNEAMKLALETALEDTVAVLRVSDYGTRGLTGGESKDELTSPLSALTRGAGISSNDGSRGGSFGIGSAVGPLLSNMQTVFYSSRTTENDETVYAGHSRLASHKDENGDWRNGDGFFTDLRITEDFKYLRSNSGLGPFSSRTKPGTDTYILGYRKAREDSELSHIRLSFMRNFALAIHRGNLIVRGISGEENWELNADTLADFASSDPESLAFIRAINDPSPLEMTDEKLGLVKLYLHIDDRLPNKFHTITVRKPLMKIDTFRHSSIHVKYAAVLECSDDKGNSFLRELEPPQHDRWDGARAHSGQSTINRLKKFVRDGIQSRVTETIGEIVEVKGLAEFLPKTLNEEFLPTSSVKGIPNNGDGTENESSTIQGASGAKEIKPAKRKAVQVKVATSATLNGDDEASGGKERGGDGSRKSTGGSIPKNGSEGEGKASIRSTDVRFRSWTDGATAELCMSISPLKGRPSGDLTLVPLGAGGSVENGYNLQIADVLMTTSAGSRKVDFEGNVLKDLSFIEKEPIHLRIRLSTTKKFRLGIE